MGETTSKTRSIDTEFDTRAKQLIGIDFGSLEDRAIMKGKYVARVIGMYDGDTLTVALINESGKLEKINIRIYGSDTPELKGDTSEAGRRAKNEALTFIGAKGAHNLSNGKKLRDYFTNNPIFVEIECMPIKEKFGRILANVRMPGNDMTLSDYLIEKKLATPYNGGTKDQDEFKNTPTEEPVISLATLEMSAGFKNETKVETGMINEIWGIINTNPEKYTDSVSKLDRKKITTILRKNTWMTVEQFIQQL